MVDFFASCFISSYFGEVSLFGSTAVAHVLIVDGSLTVVQVSGESSILLVPGLEDLVVNGSVFINDVDSVDLVHPALWSQLQDGANQKVGGADSDAGAPLSSVHLLSPSDSWEVLAHQDLGGKGSGQDQDEVVVVQELLKHVEVSSTNLSADISLNSCKNTKVLKM